MASLDILCFNSFDLKNTIMKIEHKKIFCDPSKILKNISWPINICLKYFLAPTKTLRPPLASYMFSVRSLRSFLIFSNNSVVNVDVYVNVNVDNYLNSKFYDHDFQSKPESNSKNLNRRSCCQSLV